MIGHVIPDNATYFVLEIGGGHLGSDIPLSLCTFAIYGDVGQEGIGEANQMQVCNCRLVRDVLVLAQPQKLLTVLKEHFDAPTLAVHLHNLDGGKLGGIRNESQRLSFTILSREDHMQTTQATDLEPSCIDISVTDGPMAFLESADLLTATPEQVRAIRACFEFSTALEQIAVALERRDKSKTFLAAGLDHDRTKVVAVEKDSDVNALGRLKLIDDLCGQLCDLLKGSV